MTRKGRKKTDSSRYGFRVVILLIIGLAVLAWWLWTCPQNPSPRFNYLVVEREGHLFKLFNGETLRLHPKTTVKIHRISTNICFNRGIRLVAEGFDVNALRYASLSFKKILSDRELFQHYRFTVTVKQYNRVIGSVEFTVQPHAEDWLEKADKIIDPSHRLEFLEKAQRLMPQEDLIRRRLIDEYKGQKNFAAAASLIEDMTKKAPDEDRLLELYDLYQATENRPGISRTLERLVELAPSNRDYRLGLAESYQEAGHPDRAIKTYESILSDLGGAERLPLLKILGFLYAKEGRMDKAVSSFLSAVDFDRQDANLYYNLSALYEKTGRLTKANEYLQKAVALQKDDIDNRFVLAERFLKSGEMEKADYYLNEILALNRDSLKALFLKVELLERNGNKKAELRNIYAHIHALKPHNETVTFNLGFLEYETGRFEQAAILFRKFIKAHPDDKQTHVLLFDIYQKLEKEPQAFEEAMTLLRIDPKEEGLYTYIFEYLKERDNYQLLRDIMEEGVKSNPGNIDLHQYLILAYLKTGDHDRAAMTIRETLKIEPKNVKLLLQLARLYESQGRLEEALKTYKEVMAVSPGQEEAEESYLRLRLKILPGQD